jgi:hypothetical protein
VVLPPGAAAEVPHGPVDGDVADIELDVSPFVEAAPLPRTDSIMRAAMSGRSSTTAKTLAATAAAANKTP